MQVRSPKATGSRLIPHNSFLNLDPNLVLGKLSDGEELSKAGAFYPRVWPRPNFRERLMIRLGTVKPDM